MTGWSGEQDSRGGERSPAPDPAVSMHGDESQKAAGRSRLRAPNRRRAHRAAHLWNLGRCVNEPQDGDRHKTSGDARSGREIDERA